MMVQGSRRLRAAVALAAPKKYFSTPATPTAAAAASAPATPAKPAEPVPTKIYGGLKDQDRIFTNLYGEQVCSYVYMVFEYIKLFQ